MPLHLLIALSILSGLTVGSFLNVLIFRLPQGQAPTGRSRCRHCGHILTWFELIPLVSYIFLRGKCRSCTRPISWQYPLIELATASLFLISVLTVLPSHPTPTAYLVLARNWIAISAFIVIAVIDARHQLIFDAIIYTAAVSVFTLHFVIGEPLFPPLLAGILGAAFFGAQYLISRGTWIGSGDILLGGLIGLTLSWPLTVVALALAYLLGTLIAVPLLLSTRYHLKTKIAFGSFLSFSSIIVMLWGNNILQWYLRLIFP